MVRSSVRAAVTLVFLTAVPLLHGTPCIAVKHCTDGAFNLHNGGSPTDEALEWAGGVVVKSQFAAVNGAGGSFLYVDQGFQGDNNLYLMYDYVLGTNPGSSSFFDVFFQVPPDQQDYLVRIQGNGFSAFEKPSSILAPLMPDGTFDLSAWTPLSGPDLALARFQAAAGFGPSFNSATPHLMAEFQLSINRGPGGSGLYDPAPAFWSASEKTVCNGCVDPPISSAIFQLNPDNTITVVPVLGPLGEPIQQPLPEPSTMFLLGSVLPVVLVIKARRR